MLTLRLDPLYISEITWWGCIVSGYEVVKQSRAQGSGSVGTAQGNRSLRKSTREAPHPRSSPTLRAGCCCSAWTPHAAGCHLQAVLQGKSTLNIRVTIHCDVQSCREPEKLLVELTALGSACNSSLWCSELHGTWEAAGGGNSPGLFITQAHLSVLARAVVIQPVRPVLAKRFLIFFLALPLATSFVPSASAEHALSYATT